MHRENNLVNVSPGDLIQQQNYLGLVVNNTWMQEINMHLNWNTIAVQAILLLDMKSRRFLLLVPKN